MADGQHAGIAIKILNVLVWIFFFGSNLYSSLGGPSAGYSHAKETYITPAPGTFWIWTVINVLFLGFVIYQFTSHGDHCVDVIGWRFAGLGILQAIWIHTFYRSHYVVSFIFALLVALVVSHVYWDLHTKHASHRNWGDILFIHLPFSLLHAYTVFLVILSAFAAFGVDARHRHAGVATKVLVIIALVFLASTGWGYAFNGERGDVAGALVLAVLLGGVQDHVRHPKSIHYVALVAFIVTLLAVVKALWSTFFRKGRVQLTDPERAPLVG